MKDDLNKKLSDFWTKASMRADAHDDPNSDHGPTNRHDEEGGIYYEDEYYDEEQGCPRGPYDPCDPCTWEEYYNEDGEWQGADPRPLLCDRVQDGLCNQEDVPCLKHYNCENDQSNNAGICEDIMNHWCETGEMNLPDCDKIKPPCNFGNNCGPSNDCFNCMMYATGQGGFGPYSQKTPKERCDIIVTGGGYEDPAKQECFKRFMKEQGCLLTEDCESCEGFYNNSCNCDGLTRDCKKGNIKNCVDDNPPVECECLHPLIPNDSNEKKCPSNISPFHPCGQEIESGYPASLPCDQKDEILNGWRECAEKRLERCQSLQDCMDNLPDATTCENINENINTYDNNHRCLRQACRGGSGPGGFGRGLRSAIGKGCWMDNTYESCENTYGPAATGTPSPSEYIEAPTCTNCGEVNGTTCYYCSQCLRDAQEGENLCIHQSIVSPDMCTTGVVPVLDDVPNIPYNVTGSNDGFSDYWIEVVQSYCQQFPNEMQFYDTDNAVQNACDYYDHWFCDENCRRARRIIKLKMEYIRNDLRQPNLLGTVIDPAVHATGEQISPTVLIAAFKQSGPRTGPQWCQAQGQVTMASHLRRPTVKPEKKASVKDVLDRIKRMKDSK